MNIDDAKFVNSKIKRRDVFWTAEARERLRTAVADAGSQAEIARKAGLTPSGLSAMLSDRGSEPSISKLAGVAQAAGASLDYILTGEPAANAGMIDIRLAAATASAGAGSEPPSLEFDGTVPFPKEWVRAEFGDHATLAMMQVRGDSMTPTINDGEWVLFDTARRGPTDGIYVLLADGQLLVKRLQFLDRRILASGDSDPTSALMLNEADLRETAINKVIGRVLWSGRLFL